MVGCTKGENYGFIGWRRGLGVYFTEDGMVDPSGVLLEDRAVEESGELSDTRNEDVVHCIPRFATVYVIIMPVPNP